MNNETILNIQNVSFSFNNEPALDGVSLEIKRGDFVGIIGPNGSGKTTLLKIILGLLNPREGDVTLFGSRLSQFRDWYKIGYVPQKATAFDIRFPITVWEVVSMGRISRSKFFYSFTKEDQRAIKKALQVVQMEKHSKSLINELSSGQQQRVFIVRALASEPELLILDEPTVGVDLETQEKFYELLRNLNREFKLTLLLVSHDVDVIANEVKTLVCLNRKLVYHGTPKDFIKEDYLNNLYGKHVRFILHGH